MAALVLVPCLCFAVAASMKEYGERVEECAMTNILDEFSTKRAETLRLGVAYYPEHDPESEWEQDAKLMRDLGLDCIRIGEFCWNRMERPDGSFTLDWMDRCISLFDRYGIKTILCTPTATPPGWLCERYPDIHPHLADGRQALFGGRRHGSLFHPAFRMASVRIANALAERFGQHPAVIGWQLDNEVGTYSTLDCSPVALHAFHGWLKREYVTVENLNHCWGLIFWNQEVERFDQIPAPTEMQCTRSPQHILAYNRFCHEGMADYLLLQAEAVRRHVPADRFLVASAVHPVLHQVFVLQRKRGVEFVDSVTVHHYPELMPDSGAASMHLDLMQSLDAGKPFRVLEHQVGSGSSTTGGLVDAVRRYWSLETVAQGARTLLWFHWRRFRAGCEWRLTPVVERDREPREIFQGLQSLIRELRQIIPILDVSRVVTDVQILSSYLNAIARDRSSESLFWMEIQRPDAYQYRARMWSEEIRRAAYNPLIQLGFSPAFVREDEAWDMDQPLVATDLDICPDPLLSKLEDWCCRGGVLICFPGAGERDVHGAHRDAPPPGNLSGLLGVEHAHYYPLSAHSGTAFNHMAGEALDSGANPEEPSVSIRFGEKVIAFDVRHGEVLKVRDAQVLGRYETGPYAGEAVVTRRVLGRGCAIYLGAVPKTEADAAAFYRLILPTLPVRSPGGRRLCWEGPKGPYEFLINDAPSPIAISQPTYDLLTNREVREIPPYGVIFHASQQERGK